MGEISLIDIEKGGLYVCRDRFILSAPVPRPRRCGPARREYQFRRVEQHGCREEIMIEDTHHP